MGIREVAWRSIINTTTAVMKGDIRTSRFMENKPIQEGVFAINKPAAISSAQVIRDVQRHFNPSNLFKSWIKAEQARLDADSHNQRKKRRSWKSQQSMQVKMGHGGTLDPMATGVLILGVGNGTKSLSTFLECTKSYECVLLFGAATDTYDSEGKVVARKSYDHITREKVEKALEQYRGNIMQRPPIYSALRIQGKRLYEYAREGKEVPVEIKERPVEVQNIEITEWMEGGTHQWHWPTTEAEKEEKEVVEKVLHLQGDNGDANSAEQRSTAGTKRTRDEADETVNGTVEPAGPPSPKRSKVSPEPVASGALPESAETADAHDTSPEQPVTSTEPTADRVPCPAPAVRLRMTVTSGFYVRSLCHDLGAAVGSLGIMASLVRTRQGDFELGTNVLWYDDLAEGEEVWGPKVKTMLGEWNEKAGRREAGLTKASGQHSTIRGGRKDGSGDGRKGPNAESSADVRARRNTSSDEE